MRIATAAAFCVASVNGVMEASRVGKPAPVMQVNPVSDSEERGGNSNVAFLEEEAVAKNKDATTSHSQHQQVDHAPRRTPHDAAGGVSRVNSGEDEEVMPSEATGAAALGLQISAEEHPTHSDDEGGDAEARRTSAPRKQAETELHDKEQHGGTSSLTKSSTGAVVPHKKKHRKTRHKRRRDPRVDWECYPLSGLELQKRNDTKWICNAATGVLHYHEKLSHRDTQRRRRRSKPGRGTIVAASYDEGKLHKYISCDKDHHVGGGEQENSAGMQSCSLADTCAECTDPEAYCKSLGGTATTLVRIDCRKEKTKKRLELAAFLERREVRVKRK
ncbi:unnamed protein product [Amoebophrya sp. A120]|nr:unnamed protein product [Amoebophrya sp. A120]|eukprot:GSA120T00019919001.1